MGVVDLILGRVNSGKTRSVTEQYVAFVKEHGCDRALLVVPTRDKAAHTRSAIVLEYRLPGLIAPRILTFEDVVKLVLECARHAATAISDIARRAILEGIVREMDRAGELTFFKSVAGFPGFVEVIGHLISELKLCEVEAEQFSAALDRKGASRRDKEVGTVYARYQRNLHRRSLYDTEGGYWIAARILREKGCQELQDVELMIIDGFHTFTSAELTLVEELSRFIEHIVVTLDYDSDPHREALFAAPARTYALLKERFPRVREIAMEPASDSSALTVLERELFRRRMWDGESTRVRCGEITIVKAPSELREVQEICREAKRLIVEAGYRPEDIAVVFRDLDVYGPLARDSFERYGLSCRIGAAQPLSSNPAVKTVVNALAIREHDWERDVVVRLVKSNYVRFDSRWSSLLPNWIERWARTAGIVRTREQWVEQLGRERQALESQKDVRDVEEPLSEEELRAREQRRRESLAQVREVLAFIQELGKVLDVVPEEGDTPTYVTAICEVIEWLGVNDAILEATEPTIIKRDMAAYERLVQLLGEVEHAETGATAIQWNLRDFCTSLRHVLERERAPERASPEGRISVLDVHHARHYKFPVIFIGGMVERVFPHRHDEDPLYNDAARRELARYGVRLHERGAKNAEEMFLFYTAITRGTDRVYLTYPSSDAKGQPQMRSFYVDDVLAVVEPAEQPAEMAYSEPVPDHNHVWNTADLGEWLFSALWSRRGEREGRDPKHAGAAYDHTVETNNELVRHALVNAFVEERRESSDLPDQYDGILSDPRIVDGVGRKYSQEYVFSASALDDYGCCPFVFFCRRVLGLEPVEEPEEGLTAIDRGNLYHEILWRFYTELRDDRHGETRLAEQERDLLLERMIRAARAECDEFEKAGLVGNQSLWALTRRSIERNLERFVDHEIANSERSPERCPSYFELCFGTARRPPYDLSSLEEPLIVEGVRLGGKIDRVDLVETGNTCAVVDYKTGNTATNWREVAEGRSFQLPVYWFACEELLFRERGTQCVEACFYRLCRDYADAESRLRRTRSEWEESLTQCRAYIKEYAGSIRSGKFPAIPSGGCPGWCEYRDICRYERGRIERKLERVGEQGEETEPGLTAMLGALKR
jgi:ATP-dependent helicase/nuclease subunit B